MYNFITCFPLLVSRGPTNRPYSFNHTQSARVSAYSFGVKYSDKRLAESMVTIFLAYNQIDTVHKVVVQAVDIPINGCYVMAASEL